MRVVQPGEGAEHGAGFPGKSAFLQKCLRVEERGDLIWVPQLSSVALCQLVLAQPPQEVGLSLIHFIDEEAEGRRGELTFLRSHPGLLIPESSPPTVCFTVGFIPQPH